MGFTPPPDPQANTHTGMHTLMHVRTRAWVHAGPGAKVKRLVNTCNGTLRRRTHSWEGSARATHRGITRNPFSFGKFNRNHNNIT